MNEWLPYKGTWKGEILEAIIRKGLRHWDEILRETDLSEGQLNRALSELYSEGIINREVDGSYRVIPEIYSMYKKHDKEVSRPVGVDKESRIVFVVSGRNKEARDALFTFLRSIDLHPLAFSEAILKTGKGAPYIGEILETAFSNAKAVIVLLTPDDEARLREPYRKPEDPTYEKQLTPQARPNVLFEAGMAMSQFPTRTILVQLGELRPFSDISGRHSVQLDNTIEKRRDLAERLGKAGCKISLSGTEWHTAGDFEAAIPKARIQKPEEQQGEAEIGQFGEKETEAQEDVLLPDNTDITRLGIDNDFLDRLYEQAYRKAAEIYDDARLSYFCILVYPFTTTGEKVTIHMTFYSKWAGKNCAFMYFSARKHLEHHLPDKRARFDYEKAVFTALPWRDSPKWMHFLSKAYARIDPLTPANGTCYNLSTMPSYGWSLKFEDGFSGKERDFVWDGKGLDENSIGEKS